MLDIDDLIQTDSKGRGVVNVLVADELVRQPKLYATFLLWMLSELFEHLPEVGDPEKPSLVFFFDEAHLLFNDAPAALIEKVEQVVRLIRSKGVGVYFVTQSPADIPDTVLGQLGNRVQHALRAFTPKDQKAVKTAAQTLRRTRSSTSRTRSWSWRSARRWSRARPEGHAADHLAGVDGAAVFADWPHHGCGTRSDSQGRQPIYGHYDQAVDRESAYEKHQGDGRWPKSAPRPHRLATIPPALRRPAAAGSCTGINDDGSRGDAGWRAVRHDGPARRTPRRPDQLRGQERRALGGLRRRPRHPPRRAGIHLGGWSSSSRRLTLSLQVALSGCSERVCISRLTIVPVADTRRPT